jgi:hypothetical protein
MWLSVFTKTESPASLDRRKDSRPPAVKFAPANRSQQRVNQAIEKMLARDYPALAAPDRFLGVVFNADEGYSGILKESLTPLGSLLKSIA